MFLPQSLICDYRYTGSGIISMQVFCMLFYYFTTLLERYMKLLEQKITAEGKVLPGNILKVDGFLNHRIDVPFVMELGKEIARRFENSGVTKILTIEASGIAVATAAAFYLNVPLVFAKKHKSGNISDNVYSAGAHSFTHGNDYNAVVSKEYLSEKDNVLIVDDFLALGSALECLMNIVHQARAQVAGCASIIEKGYQGGGDKIRATGVRVESLAIIESMENGTIVYRPDEGEAK